MGQTTSTPGTEYQSPSHEVAALRYSLEYLRGRVNRIGESEAPLIMVLIKKQEARLKELNESDVVSEVEAEVGPVKPGSEALGCLDICQKAKKPREYDGATDLERVLKESSIVSLKRKGEDVEDGPMAKRVRVEGSTMAQKRKYEDTRYGFERDIEAVSTDLEKVQRPIKKAKVHGEKKPNKNMTAVRAPEGTLNTLRGNTKIRIKGPGEFAYPADPMKITKAKKKVATAIELFSKNWTTTSRKRARDDVGNHYDSIFRGSFAEVAKEKRPTKKLKMTGDKKLVQGKTHPTTVTPTSNLVLTDVTAIVPNESKSEYMELHHSHEFVVESINESNITITASNCNHEPLAFERKKEEKSLREFPAEVRLKIFNYYFNTSDGKWNGKTPALICALRGNQIFYTEIMEVFYKSDQEYCLSNRNGWSFGSMSDRALESIRNLCVETKEFQAPSLKRSFRTLTRGLKRRNIPENLHKAVNIERISIESFTSAIFFGDEIFNAVKIFAGNLANTQQLNTFNIKLRFLDGPHNRPESIPSVTESMLNTFLGMKLVESQMAHFKQAGMTEVFPSIKHWNGPHGVILTQISLMMLKANKDL